MNNNKTMKQWIILILVGVLSYWLINNLDIIFGILNKILTVLTPFLLGGAIAFILNIPMSKIEKFLSSKIKNKKAPIRVISITISLILLLVVASFVLLLLIPEIIDNITALINTLPSLINDVENWVINLLDKYPEVQTQLKSIFETNGLEKIIPEFLTYIVNGTITIITNLVSGVVTVFTAIVFSIYMLSQKEYLLDGTKKILKTSLKPTVVNQITEIGKLSNKTFTKFISGQCVEAVILGAIFFVVLSIFRFPYALLISVLTTITALIPIFGALIAMVIGAILIAITTGLWQALIFVVIFQIIQQIEGNFIYPRVVGKSVGLSPIWTLFAITVGGSLFGVIGMLTAIPLASIASALFKAHAQEKQKIEK